jgi:hypothetical protein
MYQLSMERILDLLGDGARTTCLDADPTGHRNILIARDVRRRLRKLNLEGRLLEPEEVGERFRPLFRSTMDGTKLSLPSMEELIDPHAPVRPPEKKRRVRRKRVYRKPKPPDSRSRLRKRLQRRKRKKE